jgi:hypothetical protein
VAKAKDDCVGALTEAFAARKTLTEGEIKFIAEELRRRFKQTRDSSTLGHDQQWSKVARDIAEEIKETALIERRNAALNVAAKQRLLAMGRDADERYGDPSLGLEAAMVGINKPLAGGRLSVDAKGMALFDKYMGGLIGELERNGLLVHLNTGHMDLEVARVLEKLSKPEAKGSAIPEAVKIAQLIDKYRKLALDQQNRSGSWVKPLTGYITRQSHDMTKVRKAGFEAWRDAVIPLLDPRTFGDSNSDEFLREAYRTIVNGEQLSSRGADIDLNLAFKGPGNLGKRISQHRVLHFKDADAWMAYNERFGTGTLREAVLGEFIGMARNTALMETFGPNPRALFDDVAETLRKESSDTPEKVDRLRRNLLGWELDEITGQSRVATNPTRAAVGRSSRAIISMAKLGGAVLSSITDIASKAAQIRYMDGGGILSPLAKSVSTFFEGIPSKERRAVADRIRAGLDGMIGGIAERFGAVDSPSGSMSRAVRMFFKVNLLTGWTDANKRGLAMFASRSLAAHAGSVFDKLPDHMKFILGQYGIDAKKWEVARQLIEKVDDQTYLLPDIIRDLPDEAFTKHGLDPVVDREGIETAIRTYFVDVTEFGVPTPGARERAMMTWGYRPGTPEGEALRYLMQFKAFPLTVTTKVLGRKLYGNPGGKADKLGLAMYIASSTALGYLAMSMKSLQRGQTPRDPMDYKTWIAAMTQGGGFGLYGDFMLGETNRFGRSLLDTLAGPGLGIISDIDELRARIMAGDDVAGNALRLAMNNTPFVNLFYTRAALDYLILYQLQEMVNPGYLRRMERRIAKEQGQRYLLRSPSQAIPRGGGSRLFEGVR